LTPGERALVIAYGDLVDALWLGLRRGTAADG
jgi:hypothetical protein